MTATPSPFVARLESILDDSRIIADPALCAEYAIDEVCPSAVAKPSTAGEVAEIVRFAVSEKWAVIPCGNRTKLGIGMPPSRFDIALDMTGLNQIAHYDPGDLTLSVDAGANFNDFAVPLYNQKQFLPLSVPFYFESTIGGIIASGVDCGLRHSYGTARDFLIGAEFVDGTGKLCKSGGRVVKNVSGYDLHKLLIGALGTLAVITRLNFRTFPAAPVSCGFVVSFSSAEDALSLLRIIRESPVAPASIELLNPDLLRHILEAQDFSDTPPAAAKEKMFPANCWHLCVSVEGTNEVCDRSVRDLTRLADQASSKAAQVRILDENEGADLWHGIGQSVPLLLESSPVATIFKIVQLPNRLGTLLNRLSHIAKEASLAHAFVVRGSGIVYFALLPPLNEQANQVAATAVPDSRRQLTEAASSVFQLCAHENASATLPWCPTALKHTVNVWGSGTVSGSTVRSDLALMRSLKSAFDPCNVFSPGRF
jgi:glycolate oxidase FAD binding subunit